MLTIILFLLASMVAVFLVRKLFPRNRGSLPALLGILSFIIGMLLMFDFRWFSPGISGSVADATGKIGVLLIFIVGPVCFLIALARFSRQPALPR